MITTWMIIIMINIVAIEQGYRELQNSIIYTYICIPKMDHMVLLHYASSMLSLCYICGLDRPYDYRLFESLTRMVFLRVSASWRSASNSLIAKRAVVFVGEGRLCLRPTDH